jgi:hypothetical protein
MHSVSLRAPCRSGIGLSVAAPVQPVSQPDKKGPAATKCQSIVASIFSILLDSLLLFYNRQRTSHHAEVFASRKSPVFRERPWPLT